MLEVEYKAKIDNLEEFEDRLLGLNIKKKEDVTYKDTYFDTTERSFFKNEKELRVRVIKNHERRIILTYKGQSFDNETKSKPEFEVDVSNYDNMVVILKELGYVIDIEFTKICRNFYFVYQGLDILATLVSVPGLKSAYIEIESLVQKEEDILNTKEIIKELLSFLQIPEDDLTTEYYSDRIRELSERKVSRNLK